MIYSPKTAFMNFLAEPLSLTVSITSGSTSVPTLHSTVKRPIERDWNLLYCLICNSHFAANPVYLLFGWAEVRLRQVMGEITSAKVGGEEEMVERKDESGRQSSGTITLILFFSLSLFHSVFVLPLALSFLPQHSCFSPVPFNPQQSMWLVFVSFTS